jgi:hypothetical protein
MPALPALFNQNPADDLLIPWTLNGQRGWFRVPTQWAIRTNADQTMSASPNSDFSSPVYDVKLDAGTGTLVIQDLLQSRLMGQS